MVLVLALVVSAQAVEPLVVLDASKLPEGPLTAWENDGSLKGVFRNDDTNPHVELVDGVKAVVFGGGDHMTADFTAPAGITGDKPWTCVVRAFSMSITNERTLVSWASRPNNCLEIEYGEAPLWGAIGTWNDPHTLGWTRGVPETGQWHYLVYCYSGGRDGEMQAWCDGELRASKKGTLATKPNKPFVLGACMLETDPNKYEYVHQFSGSIAMVKVYDCILTPLEIWNASGIDSAYPVFPEPDSTLDKLMTTLKWLPGDRSAASYDIYLSTDRAAVEKGENILPVGGAGMWERVYKGNQPATKTGFGPVLLALGQTCYWRIDQCDTSGKVMQRGQVWTFSVESGQATNPAPADGYIFVEGGRMLLRWKPGKYAVNQNLYIGESEKEVLGKKKPDIAGLPPDVNSVPLPISNPALGKTYFWRVESINRDKLPASKGAAWTFRIVSKKLKVYLLAGQSNAVGCCSVNGIPENLRDYNKGVLIFVRGECRGGEYGWNYLKDGLGSSFGDRDGRGTFGPELTFGACMGTTSPEQVIALLKCAWGGTNLGAQWRPPSAGGQTGVLYNLFIKAVRDGLAGLDPAFEPQICGMIWMQGESDSNDKKMAEDYAKNLTCFINDIRTELKTPDMPFVLAQISKAPAWDAPPNRGPQIRAAQVEVAKTVPHTATFPTDDYKLCDPWHYDTAGMVSLGERFARAMKDLEKVKTAP